MARQALGLNAVVFLVGLNAGTAQAQYYPYYFPYAFSGSTVLGDELRGFGISAAGMGMYNLNTATANSIGTDTWMRLNQYFYESFREQNRRQAALEARRKRRIVNGSKENQTRIADHPEPRDIYQGDSLNRVAEIVNRMGVHSSAPRMTRVGVLGGTLQKAPLVHAPTQAVFSVARLDVEGQWPLLLRGPIVADARRRYEAALDSVRAELANRALSSRTLDELAGSVKVLITQFQSTEEAANPADARQARSFLKELSLTAEGLRDPLVENAFSDVMSYQGTTVADLLAFMQRHNLRFAPAADTVEKELFEDLYALLVEHRQKLEKTIEGK